MTFQEFNDGLARYQRLYLGLLNVAGLAIVGYMMAVTAFREHLFEWGAWLFGNAQAGLVFPLVLVPVVVILLGGSAVIQWILSKDRRLVCPHCGKFLAYGPARLVLVATRNCPFCGEKTINGSGSEA
jgi:hypothetical protein